MKSSLLNKLFRLGYKVFSKMNVIYAGVRKHAIFGSQGGNLAMASDVFVKYPQNISIGTGVFIGPGVVLGGLGGIVLGDNVRISQGVMIETAYLDLKSGVPYKHLSRPIVIEKNVWLASKVCIFAGVTIGENSVVAAGAVVKNNVPKDVIYFPNGEMKNLSKGV